VLLLSHSIVIQCGIKKSLDTLAVELEAFKKIITSQDQTITSQDQAIEDIRADRDNIIEQLRLALKREFGRSCEASPGQQDLFKEAETEADSDEDAGAEPEVFAVHLPATPSSVTPNEPGRKPMPAHLPRVDVIVELADDEARCVEDGSTLKVIGEEITEQLDIIPAQIRLDALTVDVLHADETTVQVTKEPDRRADQTSYMCVQTTSSCRWAVVDSPIKDSADFSFVAYKNQRLSVAKLVTLDVLNRLKSERWNTYPRLNCHVTLRVEKSVVWNSCSIRSTGSRD
jgi:hypothetical protein